MQNAKKNDGNNFEIVTAGGNVSVATAALTVNDITLDNLTIIIPLNLDLIRLIIRQLVLSHKYC